MHIYSVFGGSLRSEVDLPELRPAADAGMETGLRWTLRIADALPRASTGPAELLGSDAVMPDVDVRLYKTSSAYRLSYDDTGDFDISRDGRDIVWYKNPSAPMAAARLDIINRVLPVALHAAGAFCLHGSAVSLNGAAVAFVAPRGSGKSTLAIAMTELGAQILTDDALAMTTSSPVIASPGIHSVRLLDDAARAVIGDAGRLKAVGAYPMTRRDAHRITADEAAFTKQILRGLPPDKLMFESVPLAAVYIVVPTRPERGGAAGTRTRLPAVRAALSLVEHSKSGALLGKSEAPALFDRAVSVAREVPVFELAVLRDLARIGEVARQLAEWHPGSAVLAPS
jgi:hypothetical protein